MKRFLLGLFLLVGCSGTATTPGGGEIHTPDLGGVRVEEDLGSMPQPVDLGGMNEDMRVDAKSDANEDMSSAPDLATPGGDMGSDLGSSPGEDMEQGGDPTLLLDAPASSERVSQPFTMTMSGSGSGRVGSVEVANNLVSVEIDGAQLTGVIQERQAWSDFSLVLYQTLLVSSNSVHVAWLYCKEDKLNWIFHESNLAGMRDEPLQGSCVDAMTPGTSDVTFPEVAFSPPTPTPGYRVDGGTSVQLHGEGEEQSFAIFGGKRYRVYPFEIVDCSKDCGSPGWYEVHSFVEREEDDALGFIIFYLRNAGQVEAHYGVVWPGFEVIPGHYFNATWSTP